MNYYIVLFKNKQKRKIINKFKTLNRAKKYYDNLLQISDDVFFERQTENGDKCEYELALMENTKDNTNLYIKDNLGRTIKVETDDDNLSIKNISKYRIEEGFVDYSNKNKIFYNDFEKKYLKRDGLKLISKLNNKMIFQRDDEINLFTFKCEDDCEIFLEYLVNKFQKEKRMDCLIVKDSSKPQKKYLYNLLVEKGFPIDYLQRYSTTHLLKR
jgi:RNA recognition motif-containing protein